MFILKRCMLIVQGHLLSLHRKPFIFFFYFALTEVVKTGSDISTAKLSATSVSVKGLRL